MKTRKSNSSWWLISTVAAVLWCVAVGRAGATDLPSSASGNLKLYLRSDVGVTIDTSTQEVTEWADQSGNGNDATPTTVIRRPGYVGGALNGLPAIRFTSSQNDSLKLPTAATLGIVSTNYEYFVVARTTDGANVQFLLSGGTSGNYELHINGAAGLRFIPLPGSAWWADTGSSGDYADGAAYIFAARLDASNGNLGVGRVDGADGTDWTDFDGRSSDTANLYIGSRNTVTATWDMNGDIFEVLIYNTTLTSTEREQVEAYLAERWQASVASLPASASGNLSLYLKSDVGIAENVNGVAQWLDQSGNGNHASTSGNEPDVISNVVQGKPAIQFTAANSDHIDLPTPSALGIQNEDYELFIVAKYNVSQVSLLIAGGYEDYEILAVNATSANFIPNGYSGGDGGSILAASFGDGSTHIVSGRVDANNSHYGLVRIDGTDSTDWTTFDARSSDNTALRLGVRTSATPRYFAGDMFEVLIYNRTLTDVERVAVEYYLKERWMATSDYTWDSSGGSLPLADGAGTWAATGGNNWYDGSTYGAWGNTALDKAIIGVGSGAADTITVSGTVTLNDLQFDPPGSGNYTLSSGTLSLAGVSPTMTLNTDAEIASTIAGTASLTKTGDGTLTLSGNNTYSGVTTVSAGVLQLGHINALGATSAGTVVESGTALDLNAFGYLGTGIDEPLTVSGAGTGSGYGALYNSDPGTGPSDQSAWAAIDGVVTLAGDTTVGGVGRIDNYGEITDNGNGYTLTKTGTFGFIRVGAANFSHLVIDQGSYTVNGNSALPGSSGTVTVNNAGTGLTLYGLNRTVSNEPNITFSNSTYQAIYGSANNASINGTMTLKGAVTFKSRQTAHTIDSDIDGSGDLTLTSLAGVAGEEFIFAGNNTYTGSTTVGNGSSGAGKIVLVAGSANAFGNNSAFDVTANSTLELAGNDNAIGSLSGNGTVENANATAATLSTGGDDSSTIFAGTLQDGSGAGALALTKTGDGTLTLSGDNTYSGLTTVSGGILIAKHNTALGDPSVGTTVANAADAALRFDGSGGDLAIGEPITIQGAQLGSIRNLSGNNTLTGLITLQAKGDFRQSDGRLTLSGGVTGTDKELALNGPFTVNTLPISVGTGTVSFTSNGNSPANPNELNVAGNTWGGTGIRFGGYVTLGVNDALPTTTDLEFGWSDPGQHSGTLDLNGNDQTIGSLATRAQALGEVPSGGAQAVTGGGTLTVNQSIDTEYQGVITTATALIKTGSGTLTLSGANTYSGGTTLSAGTLVADNPNALGGSSGALTVNAGTLVVNTDLSVGNVSSISGSTGVIDLNNGATFTPNVSANYNYYGGITGDGNLYKIGNGVGWRLHGTLDYSGSTTVSAGYMVLQGANTTLPVGTLLTVDGFLDLTGSTKSPGSLTTIISGLTGSGKIYSYNGVESVLHINIPSGSQTFSGVIGYTQPHISLIKDGAGTQILSGANNYNGGTTVSEGTLKLGAHNVLPDGGAVTLAGGTLDPDVYADSVGTLKVTAGSTIALGDGSARLAFDNSSGETWTADVQLTGELGTSAPTALRFGINGSGLEQNQIDRFVLGGSWSVHLDGNGYLVALNRGAIFLFR